MKKREALAAAVRSAVDRWCDEPFAWGQSDCLLSLSDIIHEARGYDPASQFRGRYKTRLGAYRVTKELGGPSGALAAMAYGAGWREIDPANARVGDVGSYVNGAASGGVVKDACLWLGRTETGFAGVPTDHVERAWRVK
jgi:hypothetical protein